MLSSHAKKQRSTTIQGYISTLFKFLQEQRVLCLPPTPLESNCFSYVMPNFDPEKRSVQKTRKKTN